MISVCVKFPLDFERLDPTRNFVRKLASLDYPAPMLHAFRAWMDFAIQKKRARQLAFPAGKDFPTDYDWPRDPLLFGIMAVEDPAVMIAAIESGFILLERGEKGDALILAGFWEINSDLDPNFKSIQSRGADAANAARRRKKADEDAETQAEIHAAQGLQLFNYVADPSPEEKQKSYALIIRIHRACDRPAPAFDETLMTAAVGIVRQYSEADIDRVEGWFIDHRADPGIRSSSLVNLLNNFREHYRHATAL